ncbi:MAG TPA: hypothetical protein VFW86_02485 [Candidatus Limnocylindrales bacterium]|nr:hypothetical protein [Candidatus Limnocylindrales bacterium]
MALFGAEHDYLETENLKLSLTTGNVWRKLDEDTVEHLGPIEDEANCPVELWEEWEYLLIEWRDRCRCGDAYRATVESSYYARLSAPC